VTLYKLIVDVVDLGWGAVGWTDEPP
jgi:hypothetical protein